MLEDSLKIHQRETSRTGRLQQFTRRDVEAVCDRFHTVEYGGGRITGVSLTIVTNHNSKILSVPRNISVQGSVVQSGRTPGSRAGRRGRESARHVLRRRQRPDHPGGPRFKSSRAHPNHSNLTVLCQGPYVCELAEYSGISNRFFDLNGRPLDERINDFVASTLVSPVL